MTEMIIAAITQGFGASPICGADKTLQIIFRRKIFSGYPENKCAAFLPSRSQTLPNIATEWKFCFAGGGRLMQNGYWGNCTHSARTGY